AGAFALRRRSLAGTLGRWSRHPADPREAVLWGLGLILGVMAFGLSFEIDRVIEQALARGGSLTWPPGQLKHLGWTVLWTGALCAFLGVANYIERQPARRSGWLRSASALPLLIAVKFLAIDTLLPRVLHGAAPATVFANFQ